MGLRARWRAGGVAVAKTSRNLRPPARLTFLSVDLAHAKRLRCPVCSATPLDAHAFGTIEGRCREGVLVCRECSSWNPIVDFVAEVLPPGHEAGAARARLYEGHREALEGLGLDPPAEAGEPDERYAAQAHQREYFDSIAHRDDEYSYRAFGELSFQRAHRNVSFDEWRRRISRDSVLLDIGCADGLSTFEFAELDADVLAFDISPEQVAQAARRAREMGFRRASFFVGDAHEIPVSDASVDVVVCWGVLHHLPDPGHTVAEAARVLKEGGAYFGMENNRTPLRSAFDALMRLSPLWEEEAGAQPLIDAEDLDRWAAGTGLEFETRTSVFVPPHVLTRMSAPAATRALARSDRMAGGIPGVRDWGGTILIEGHKRSRDRAGAYR